MTDSTIGTVTVMFTDLVGSTALRTRVGEDAAEVLRAIHDVVLTDAIAANGGRVVKHLGDGLMATFASSARAVGAAVAMQQRLDVHNRRTHGERMEIRVGISVGDVSFDGEDCFGLPVIEAQRLEASAEPATIRCAEMVMMMSRGRGGFEFRSLGGLELKGLAEPLPACEVMWTPLAEVAAPSVELGLPPVFAHGGGLPFAGRDAVFEQLVDAWKRCVTGGFEVVLLAGEPGVGKTRLAQELAVRVHSGEGIVLGGRSDEDVAVPFQSFGAALDWYVRQLAPDERLARLGEFPGDLRRLVPELERLVTDLPEPLEGESDVVRYRLFQAVTSWLAIGGVDRPRLLVLDDLHWADKPTLLLLRHLISNPPAGLMVVCTYRDTDVDRTHPLSSVLADLRRLPAVSRIALVGLGHDGVRDLLARTGGHDLDERGVAFATAVHRETAGNPFFVGEVLRHLAETGALYERDGRWTSDLSADEASIPEGIREVVGRRLSRLGDDVEGVLRSAAVIGYEFDVELLAEVTGRDADDVLDLLDRAAAANLVLEVGVDRHRFAHALVRETLHAELSSSRRARQHRKVAEAIEARHGADIDRVITELATHWMEASAGGDPTRAVELALRAGDLAAERNAAEISVQWYERVLEVLDDDDVMHDVRRRTLVKLAECQVLTGALDGARSNALAAARAAIAARDGETASAAGAVSIRNSFDSNEPADPEQTAVLRQILEMDVTSAQRASVLCALATELIYEHDIDERQAVIDEWTAITAAFPPAEWARAGGPGVDSFHEGREETALRVERCRRAAQDETSLAWRLRVDISLWICSARIGDRDGMDDALARMRTDRAPLGPFGSRSLIWECMHLTINSELGAANEVRQTMNRVFREIQLPEAAVYQTTTSIAIGRELGTLADMDSLANVMDDMGHPASAARALAAYIRLLQGDQDRVRTSLANIDGQRFADDAGLPVVLSLWSEIAAALRSEPHCRRFIDELTPQLGVQLVTGGIHFGSVSRLLALLYDALDDGARADELFTQAVTEHEALRSPPWIARTRLDWAESLHRRSDSVRVREQLDAARAAIGDLVLPDSQHRLTNLAARAAF